MAWLKAVMFVQGLAGVYISIDGDTDVGGRSLPCVWMLSVMSAMGDVER